MESEVYFVRRKWSKICDKIDSNLVYLKDSEIGKIYPEFLNEFHGDPQTTITFYHVINSTVRIGYTQDSRKVKVLITAKNNLEINRAKLKLEEIAKIELLKSRKD